LLAELNLASRPVWLNQVHGNHINVAITTTESVVPDADASYTRQQDIVLAVMVADCLPVLLCAEDGQEVAVVHAGWRGLASGIIERAVKEFETDRLIAWLGPGIGPCHYEVDDAVKARFSRSRAFTESEEAGHWMFNLYAEASAQLRNAGVKAIYGGNLCTYCDDRFFSYRRDGQTGRFAVLIWMNGLA
jgi:YfiH family protein